MSTEEARGEGQEGGGGGGERREAPVQKETTRLSKKGVSKTGRRHKPEAREAHRHAEEVVKPRRKKLLDDAGLPCNAMTSYALVRLPLIFPLIFPYPSPQHP